MSAVKYWVVVASVLTAIQKQIFCPLHSNWFLTLTKKLLKDHDFIEKCLNTDIVFLRALLEQLEGGVLLGYYWTQRKGNVFPMIEQLGKPMLFLTLSMSIPHNQCLLEVVERVKELVKVHRCRVDAVASYQQNASHNFDSHRRHPSECPSCPWDFTCDSHLERQQCCDMVDIEDLFYSIPHDELFVAVRKLIDHCSAVNFQNACGSGSSTSRTTAEHDKSQQRCRLRCDFCDYETGELLCLKEHVRLHTIAGPLLCHLCPQSFSRRDTLKKHLRIHTASRHFSCAATNEGRYHEFPATVKQEELQEELKEELPKELHEELHEELQEELQESCLNHCDCCEYATAKLSTLIIHKRKHMALRHSTCLETAEGEKLQQAHVHRCRSCDYKTERLRDLKVHKRLHTDERPYECHLCPQKFTQLCKLKNHLRIHSGERPFQCPSCPLRFSQKAHLVQHLRIHTGERPYRCAVCFMSFTRNPNLTRHMIRRHHDTMSNIDAFQLSSNCGCLPNMAATSSCKDPVMPPLFSTPINLTRIVRQELEAMAPAAYQTPAHDHLGSKLGATWLTSLIPSLCEALGRSSRSATGRGGRPKQGPRHHRCHLCSYVTEKLAHLRTHERIHTGERPFRCHFCSQRFSQNSHLKSHLRLHTGERPFPCAFCSMSFTQPSQRNRHMKRRHPDATQ
ncbi:zinc finger protein 678-like [Dermacentor albipictus]|uniref:zinc finger protein 678-like n=1 Tax=Dermacentor albipictus TaxID=60249 RepID=UPI0038FCB37B